MSESKDILTQYYTAKWQWLVEEATLLLRGDVMAAEDVVQAVFLRLLVQCDSKSTHLSPLTPQIPALVHTVMRNMLCDLWRRRRHEQEYEHRLATAPPWTPPDGDGFSLCSARQIAELLEHRLARMDCGTAKVLRMNVMEGKTTKEIAKELDLKYKSAENRLQAGRRQLREYLKKVI